MTGSGPRVQDLGLTDEFWGRVNMLAGECWEWTGKTSVDGYGVSVGNRSRHGESLTHRIVYTDQHGPIPPGMVVRHKCDNPPCVNPAHLLIGTRADNVADMDERGRRVVLTRATGHGRAKYSQSEIDGLLVADSVCAYARNIGMPLSTAYVYRKRYAR